MFCLIIFLHECILVFYSRSSAAQNLSRWQWFTLRNLYLIIFTQVLIYSLDKQQIKYIYVKIIWKYEHNKRRHWVQTTGFKSQPSQCCILSPLSLAWREMGTSEFSWKLDKMPDREPCEMLLPSRRSSQSSDCRPTVNQYIG